MVPALVRRSCLTLLAHAFAFARLSPVTQVAVPSTRFPPYQERVIALPSNPVKDLFCRRLVWPPCLLGSKQRHRVTRASPLTEDRRVLRVHALEKTSLGTSTLILVTGVRGEFVRRQKIGYPRPGSGTVRRPRHQLSFHNKWLPRLQRPGRRCPRRLGLC